MNECLQRKMQVADGDWIGALLGVTTPGVNGPFLVCRIYSHNTKSGPVGVVEFIHYSLEVVCLLCPCFNRSAFHTC